MHLSHGGPDFEKHVSDNVIDLDQQAILFDLARRMAIADMPGQSGKTGAGHLQKRLGGGDHGGALILDDGREVEIQAAPEALLEVKAPDLTRIAWHIGNRHTPCQIEKDRLLIQVDHVIRDMLLKIGASLREVHEPFTPEGGAYGHGRTHGHAH